MYKIYIGTLEIHGMTNKQIDKNSLQPFKIIQKKERYKVMYDGRPKEVIVIDDSVLNKVNSRGLSKSKTVEVISFPGATSTDIIKNIDKILENQQ